MIRRFFLPVTLAAIAGVALRNVPDLVRYLRIREM
jgi:hypothetical protein